MIPNIKLSRIMKLRFFWALQYPFPKRPRRVLPLYRGSQNKKIVLYPKNIYDEIKRRSKKLRRKRKIKKRTTTTKIGPKRVKFFKNFFRTKKKGIKGIHSHSNFLNTPIFAKDNTLIRSKWQEHARLIFKRAHGLKRKTRRKRNKRYHKAKARKNRYIRLNIFPFLSCTKKPIHTRMGKGKGKPTGFIGVVTAERPLFEANSSTSVRWIKNFIKKLNYRSPIFMKEKQKKRNLYKRVHQALFPSIESTL